MTTQTKEVVPQRNIRVLYYQRGEWMLGRCLPETC